jgi:hypothetical protein
MINNNFQDINIELISQTLLSHLLTAYQIFLFKFTSGDSLNIIQKEL